MLPPNGAFDVDMVQQYGQHYGAPTINTNGALYHEQENNRKKWMLPKKKLVLIFLPFFCFGALTSLDYFNKYKYFFNKK